MNEPAQGEPCKWWGDFTIPESHFRDWQLGPLTLRIVNLQNEWQVIHSQDEDPWLSGVSVSEPAQWGDHEESLVGERLRFAVNDGSEQIFLFPALADRSIVARPDTPLSLPAGEDVAVYVTSPLWLKIALADGERVLMELPTFRPKDTWLGPSNTQGQLCYGSRDPARLYLEGVPNNPTRVICKMRIANKSDATIQLPRVLLPTGLLKLFVDRERRFWTQELTLEMGKELEPVLGRGAPVEAIDPREVSECRSASQSKSLLTALGGMLG